MLCKRIVAYAFGSRAFFVECIVRKSVRRETYCVVCKVRRAQSDCAYSIIPAKDCK